MNYKLNKPCSDLIALSLIPNLGARRLKLLLDKVRLTEEIFDMPLIQLQEILGAKIKGVEKVKTIRGSKEYTEEMDYIEKHKIEPICILDKAYPKALNEIYDPPVVLYGKGGLVAKDVNAVAIVGSRRCSVYGLQMAEKLGFELAQKGVTIVSGMARGIDQAAAKGALKAGGRTIAVIGSGFKHIYPAGSEELVQKISGSGAVFTEYSSNTMPSKITFPRRNRIISGMAKGVVVVEAAKRSGAMITVKSALEQARDVFAVPGRADSFFSKGTNVLIQKGAKLVMEAEDILEELRLEPVESVPSENKTGFVLDDMDQKILNILKEKKSVQIEQFLENSDISLKTLPKILLKLQINGLIEESAGKNYALRQ
ncbi:MAG: DNA-processing protein DprA [Candidatus Omnitrophota bacterium]